MASSEVYCLISNEASNIVIIQCLGYDWNKNIILNMMSIHINHHIHNQFFLEIMLDKEIITWIARTQNDKNNQIG